FSRKKARYLTFDKLQQIGLNHEPPPPRNTRLWPWRRSQLLIIDDVTAGIPNSVVDRPKLFFEMLKELGPIVGRINKRNTVCCLGADLADVGKWRDALQKGCDISDENLLTVTLRSPEKAPEGKKDPVGSIGYIHGEPPPVRAR